MLYIHFYFAAANPVLKWDEQNLRTFKRKVLLRKIYGPTREKEGRRIKYNYELYDLYNAPETVTTVKLGGSGG
jgi:hypothetical protein